MSNKLHIEGGTDRPDAMKHYLDLIDRKDYNSVDEVMDEAHRRFGFEVRDTRRMNQTLYRIGLVQDDNRQQLTEQGRFLVDVLLYDESLFYEMLHFLYSTSYDRAPDPDRLISWSYFHISEALTARAPTEYDDVSQEIIDTVEYQADEANGPGLDDPGPLSKKSLNNYQRFIKRLDPDVIEDETFELRTFAPESLVIVAIDHIYRTNRIRETVEYGDLLQVSDEVADAIQTICLVTEESLTDILEHAASAYSPLSIKADYEIRLRLNEPVEINVLA